MKLYSLKTRQIVPVSIEEAWAFFSSPNNLSKITPRHMNFKILSELPSKIYPGMIIEYKVTPVKPFTTGWVTEITQVNAPHFFIDEQRFGPYAFWHHQHHLREVPQGTEVTDWVHYGIPWGFVGRFAHWLFVKRQLNTIFEYRENALIELFGKPGIKTETQQA